MDFWLPAMIEFGEDGSDWLEIAPVAEAVGFRGIALIDHVAVPQDRRSMHPSGDERVADDSPFLDPFQLAVALAARTERLRFVTYSYVLPMRHPLAVAKQVATAAILTGGRFTLGVGVGWLREEFDLLAQDPRTRGQRADEMLQIVSAALTTGRVDYSGRHYTVPACSLRPAPPDPVPVWVGGMSEPALERAARHDGWMSDAHSVDEIIHALAAVRAKRREAMGTLDGFGCLVAAAAPASAELFGELEQAGATGIIGAPWWPGDAAAATLDGKIAAVERFARKFIGDIGDSAAAQR